MAFLRLVDHNKEILKEKIKKLEEKLVSLDEIIHDYNTKNRRFVHNYGTRTDPLYDINDLSIIFEKENICDLFNFVSVHNTKVCKIPYQTSDKIKYRETILLNTDGVKQIIGLCSK